MFEYQRCTSHNRREVSDSGSQEIRLRVVGDIDFRFPCRIKNIILGRGSAFGVYEQCIAANVTNKNSDFCSYYI